MARQPAAARDGPSPDALDRQTLLAAFQSLRDWVRERNWRGFDPYDGLKSTVLRKSPLTSFKWGRIATTQLFKHSPLNLRRVLGVEPGVNPKALALFLSGTILARNDIEDPALEEDAFELARLLEKTRSEGWSGSGWGYDFPWQSRVFYLPEGTPTIVVTSYVGNSLVDLYEHSGEEVFLQRALEAGRFILDELHRTYDSDRDAFCWSYSPLDQTRVYNATLLGSRLLARLHHHNPEDVLKKAARASAEYVVRRQDERGAWIYGEASSQRWVDNFHTGFNLECLHDYMRYTGDDSYQNALDRGFRFYVNRLFEPDGAPRYYVDSLYPVDIHCCAQAVITGVKLRALDKQGDLAVRVLRWTLEHMRDGDGFFYFQKRRFYTHKVPFMRWSQAWMYLALAMAMDARKDRGDRAGTELDGMSSEHGRGGGS